MYFKLKNCRVKIMKQNNISFIGLKVGEEVVTSSILSIKVIL